MEDGISNALKVIIFLVIFVGGLISDIAKKNKAKKKMAEELERAAESQSGDASATAQNAAPKPLQTQPPKKTAAPRSRPAKPNTARDDDTEWLSTLADMKRRDAVKANAKTAAKSAAFEQDAPINEPRDTSSATPFSLSAQQAKEGFVLAEILGPPVSMR